MTVEAWVGCECRVLTSEYHREDLSLSWQPSLLFSTAAAAAAVLLVHGVDLWCLPTWQPAGPHNIRWVHVCVCVGGGGCGGGHGRGGVVTIQRSLGFVMDLEGQPAGPHNFSWTCLSGHGRGVGNFNYTQVEYRPNTWHVPHQ
jgi:hypothetical protein